MRQYRIHATGGPEVLSLEEAPIPEPTGDQVLVRHRAIGLNFVDTYFRSGLYPMRLPFTPGAEGAGVVEAVGPGVSRFRPGDRVAYAQGLGAYADCNLLPEDRLLALPDDISDEVAAAGLLKGLTVCYLITRTYPVTAETTLLLHAAAGGTGLIFCQWARHIGATVIGTVGSAEKAQLAGSMGATHLIAYREEDVAQRVRALTDGAGVQVVYDSVGRDTFQASMDSLAPLGMFVSFGNASGSVPPIDARELQNRGSLFFTRPTLATYAADREDLEAMASEFFYLVSQGIIEIPIHQRYALEEAAAAHRDLEGRRTRGASILLP